ncbi:galactofuranosyltransferase [Ligilactobacillus sp. WILCCON 0076]|uniref:Galactofuranosyltransferase n=1 Tax=Ligilactobacillus ubinensis TaxID=2876789 RepID=A0A9X2FL46_9LACO|nr:galactofuranosyltransferase [Ligilactobacillus ubinensis]MCP0887606.1 galactofuranosyltransferase [Ligilactobacillus ubinensis]
MNNYVLSSVLDKNSKHAGPKAKVDIDEFLQEEGYQVLSLNLPTSRLDKLGYRFFKLPQLFKGKKIDNIIFQYPIYSVFLTKQIIAAIRKYTQARIIFVIHDVETLRIYKENSIFKQDELAIFNSVDMLIVHNAKMLNWLKKQGIITKMITLGVFDYRNHQIMQPEHRYNKTVCFAGNLQKSSFLTELSLQNSCCKVFGPHPAASYPKCIEYLGVYPADDLPKYLTQDFGLVWDGTSLDECDGVFGEYLKYNAPHKTSLYLSTGLPVIIWKQAAMADFIVANKVGIAIENLHDLDDILAAVTQEEYHQMKENALEIGQQIRQGKYIITALKKALSIS